MPVTIDDQNGDIIAGGAGSGGTLVLRSGTGQDRLSLTAGGLVEAGGNGADGELRLYTKVTDLSSLTSFQEAVFQLKCGLAAEIIAGGQRFAGRLVLRDGGGKIRITLDARSGDAQIGGDDSSGDLLVRGAAAPTIQLHGARAEVKVGAHGAAGSLKLLGDKGKETVWLDGSDANIWAGGEGVGGDIILRGKEGRSRIRLSGGDAKLAAGGEDAAGKLLLLPVTNEPSFQNDDRRATIRLDGGTADIEAGGQGTEGDLVLRDTKGEKRVSLSGGGIACVGGKGSDGVLAICDKNGENSAAGDAAIRLDAGKGEFKVKDCLRFADGALHLGARNLQGRLVLRDLAGDETIRVEGQTGDVILVNADCAEDFDLAGGEERVPGAVMVLSEDGSLRQSEREYDTAVAGVVSGAGSYRPGIVLDRRASAGPRVPLAMVGKVFCLVDADFGAVRAGTLLTTSPRRGHAMRASDPARAFGAVLGKALKPLESGQALIPVMVALQ